MFLTTSPYFLMAALIGLASGGIFAVRYVKPAAAREYDIIFATLGLIYAGCLLLEGQRLIPLLFFAQVVLAAIGAWFVVETFRLRLQLADKSKQLQGKSPGRQGFTRTYKPGQYETGRTVTTRRASGRMRTAEDYSRTIENRETRRRSGSGERPRLPAADTTIKPRRSPPPPVVEEEIDEAYADSDGYENWDRDEPPASPPPRKPRRRSYNDDQPPASGSPRRRPPRLPDDEDEAPRSRRVIEVERVEVEDDYEDE
jgi:hypothetical protein